MVGQGIAVTFPDAETKLVGVVGHPISHTLSPAFWNAALRHDERNAVFLAFEVTPDDFADFVIGMRAAGAIGFNVTMPHKAHAFAACTHRSDEAEATGAVNVVVFEGDVIRGYNTDVYGVTQAVADLGPRPERALLIGAGGAGRAAALALARQDVELVIANRTLSRARELCDTIGGRSQVVGWAEIANAAETVDLIVHTTSVGLDGKATVLDDETLRRAGSGRLRAVLDVVYRPGETPLVHAARKAGLHAQDGLRMLVHQAAEAYRLFFGAEPPTEVMHEAAAQAAGRHA